MDFVHPFVRGGLDEKMRRMWLGREIVVVGLAPLQKEKVKFMRYYCYNFVTSQLL